MKKLTFALAGILFSSNVFCQALKSGFESLKNQKLSDAQKVFAKALDKGTEPVAAMYGLGCVISDPNFPNPSTIKAFRFVRNAHDRYKMLSQNLKDVCKNVYGFQLDDIKAKMGELAQAALDKVKENNTVDDYTWFVTTFEGADKQVAEALDLKSELVWATTCKAGTFRAYFSFASDYPNSKHAAEAQELAKESWKKICETHFCEGELYSMQVFAKQYPDYPFYTDDDKKAHALALEAEKLKMHLSYNINYEKYYKDFIDKAAPNQLAFVALQRVIQPYLDDNNYGTAISTLLEYRPKFPERQQDIDKIVAILKDKTVKLNPVPFPKTVNTDHYEYAPVITPDGSTLYFCGNGRSDNMGGEDIFVSENYKGSWQQAKLFPKFNTVLGNEAPLAVSPDGNMLLIYKDSNIYFTEKRHNGWTELKKMAAINTENSWEADAFFSPDGNAIFFISDRKGNVGMYHPHEKPFHGSYQGNTDIYVCTKDADGDWGEPINLGDKINTPFCERSPMLASDMKTLYFSSDGHYGLGHLDVFKSERLSDTSWTQWSEPVNLGKEINTSNDDYNYIVSTDGKSAYFSKISSTKSDLCTIELPISMRPDIIASVYGIVTNTDGDVLSAKIKWEDLETGKQLGNLQCDPNTGKYFITLPAGKNYGYFVDFDGYYPVSGNLNTDKLKEGKNIEHNIVMHSISDVLNGSVSITLSNIFFETGKFDLKPESYPELKRLADFISSNSDAKLEISGHTDNVGSHDSNKLLSQKRADSVKSYLVSIGCSESAIQSVGYGPDKPVASNSTESGKAQNRRVEFRILK